MVKVKRPEPPNQLRALRTAQRRTQLDVAVFLGISQSRYWQIENSYREPTETERQKLAKLFGVTEAEAFPSSEAVA